MIVNHFEGDPDGCSEHCSANNSHPGQAPAGFICAECGGNAMCYPTCIERELRRPYEEYEGQTGEQEYFESFGGEW